jgi:hypothetical protein
MHKSRQLARLLLAFTNLTVACTVPHLEQHEGDFDIWPRNVTAELNVNRKVDILFVIDNSGSMGDDQAKLAAEFSSMLGALENGESPADYRIAVVSTQVDATICLALGEGMDQSLPGNGTMNYVSCLDRPDDFTRSFGGVRRFNTACASQCTLHGAELATLPTVTALDPTPRSRPWISRENTELNLAPGVDVSEAFSCIAPQGINGCGIEAPLEAMAQALEKSADPTSPNYGFLREDAALAVVFLTDENDCSLSALANAGPFSRVENGGLIWPAAGELGRVDWACMYAGATCSGGDELNYASCEPENWNEDRTQVLQGSTAMESAMLIPLERYTSLLDRLSRNSAGEKVKSVHVSLIGGVDPITHAPRYAPMEIANGERLGLAPGCSGEANVAPEIDENGDTIPAQTIVQEASPPVRLRSFVETIASADPIDQASRMHSICSPSFSDPLAKIGEALRIRLQPTCYDACVEDSDPSTTVLDPDCTLTESNPISGEEANVAECLRDANGYLRDANGYVLPAGVELCFAYRPDSAELTADPYDQLDPRCIARGANLEFAIQRAPGSRPAFGTKIMAECRAQEAELGSCRP